MKVLTGILLILSIASAYADTSNCSIAVEERMANTLYPNEPIPSMEAFLFSKGANVVQSGSSADLIAVVQNHFYDCRFATPLFRSAYEICGASTNVRIIDVNRGIDLFSSTYSTKSGGSSKANKMKNFELAQKELARQLNRIPNCR